MSQVIYEKQQDFYLEDVALRDIGEENVQSNKIKKILHQILTKAIFTYQPCSNLLHLCKKKPPNPDKWSGSSEKWLYLTAEPYQRVS